MEMSIYFFLNPNILTFCQSFVPFAVVINKALDLIPGFSKLDIDAEGLKKKFGVKFSSESADSKKHFASVDALAEYISQNRG